MKRVEIRIRGEQVKVETSGFYGEACTETTRGLTQRLGGEVTSVDYTPEMHMEPPMAETEEA